MIVPMTLDCMDAVTWLRTLKDRSIDCIITDPAYESLEKHRARGTTTRLTKSQSSSNDWFDIFPNSRYPELFRELYRVLRTDRHAYIFCDDETSDVLRQVIAAMPDDARFTWWKRIVWDKGRMSTGYHYRAVHEFIVFLEKGSRQLKDSGSMPSILRCPGIRGGYPGEKPVPLLKTLIEQSTKTREIVIDPFAGSGSAALAALELGRRFRGTDISRDAWGHANARLGHLLG